MSGVYGRQKIDTGNSEFNALMFVISQVLSGVHVATLVQVVNAYPGGTGVTGTVDVLPLVQQTAGDGTVIPHTTIYGLPYLRIQGGANAVIIDPEPGDIGFCVFADSDITNAQNTCAPALPASGRKFDFADGLYLGGWGGNKAPTSFVQINSSGITITSTGPVSVTSPSKVTVDSPLVSLKHSAKIGSGVSGSFTTTSGSVVTVQDGIIVNIT